jgi:hypothetical protein
MALDKENIKSLPPYKRPVGYQNSLCKRCCCIMVNCNMEGFTGPYCEECRKHIAEEDQLPDR